MNSRDLKNYKERVWKKDMIEAALDLTYEYALSLCKSTDIELLKECLRKLSCKEEYKFKNCNQVSQIDYIEVQGKLSNINEKESIRKSKGVYYTPYDVVNFIVDGTLKISCNEINEETINPNTRLGMNSVEFVYNKTVFDPTCGAGEYLLAVLEKKLAFVESSITKKRINKIAISIYGNDINFESDVIAKLRLFLALLKKFGLRKCSEIPDILNKNFSTRDYVISPFDEDVKFDFIVGNPPYVEDSKSGLILNNKYGNIYANVLINCAKNLKLGGSFGFIIPISYNTTPRMRRLRDELAEFLPVQYIMSYADRPDCLFNSVHQKLCILIAKQEDSERKIYSGSYQYWYTSERNELFDRTHLIKNEIYRDDCIPKLGSIMDRNIYLKIFDRDNCKSVYEMSRVGNEKVFLNRRETFWIKAYRTYIADPEYKVFSFENAAAADYCYCLLNSSLFWWYWICTSDCWHVSKELNGFMAPFDIDYLPFSRLAAKLANKLEKTKVYVGTKQTDYEYKHRLCIDVIHEIDDYINELFGLSAEESEYIKNYALNYRMSGGV